MDQHGSGRLGWRTAQGVHAVPSTMPELTDLELRQVFEQHAPLVDRLARSLGRKLPASVDADDLRQDGHIALINAILSTFTRVSAEHFKNYVMLRVHGAMLDGLRAMDHGSRKLRRDMRAVEQAMQKLGHRLGRAPLERELAAELDMPLRTYQRMLQEAADYSLISLDDLVPSEDMSVADLGGDSNPLAVLERAALRQQLAKALDGLSAQSTRVMVHYYVDDLKMHEIGKKMQVSEARISQIHTQAIAQLRAGMVDGSGTIAALKPRRSTRT